MDDNTNDINGAPDAGRDTASGAVADPGDLQQQRDQYYDLLLRKQAEFEKIGFLGHSPPMLFSG